MELKQKLKQKQKSSRPPLLRVLVTCAMIVLAIGAFYIGAEYGNHLNEQTPKATNVQTVSSFVTIHCLITIRKNGVIVFQQYHAGQMTYLGYNYTIGKLIGNSTLYNATQYNENVTYISIGYNSTNMVQSLTSLPNEWNRTSCTQHAAVYNANPASVNFTATFNGITGSQTAGCIGLDTESAVGGIGLIGYDTFAQQTGIGSTYTITVEFKLQFS